MHRNYLRWSLAGCCGALLWLAAYLGGRDAGFDRAYDAAFAAARHDGFAAGKIEGIRRSQERYSRPGIYEVAYSVGDVLREREAKKNPGQRPESRASLPEFDWLIDEIVTNIAPDRWPEFGGRGGYSIRGFPTNLTLVVSAEAGHHAEIDAYLESKDDFFAWKNAKETR